MKMRISKSTIAVAACFLLALPIVYFTWHNLNGMRPRHIQRETFQNGYTEQQYPLDQNVMIWELWRETNGTQKTLITVCVIRDGRIDAVMPSDRGSDTRTQAMFFVWIDRNGFYRFDKEYLNLSSLLPTFKRAAQARQRQKPKDVVWPITFGLERGTPADSFFSILKEAYPFGEDGIEVMRDVDLKEVPVFGLSDLEQGVAPDSAQSALSGER